jgi:hypothetical protein
MTRTKIIATTLTKIDFFISFRDAIKKTDENPVINTKAYLLAQKVSCFAFETINNF